METLKTQNPMQNLGAAAIINKVQDLVTQANYELHQTLGYKLPNYLRVTLQDASQASPIYFNINPNSEVLEDETLYVMPDNDFQSAINLCRLKLINIQDQLQHYLHGNLNYQHEESRDEYMYTHSYITEYGSVRYCCLNNKGIAEYPDWTWLNIKITLNHIGCTLMQQMLAKYPDIDARVQKTINKHLNELGDAICTISQEIPDRNDATLLDFGFNETIEDFWATYLNEAISNIEE